MNTGNLPQASTLRRIIETALEGLARTERAKDGVRHHVVFDCRADHYLLIAEGWHGLRRVYRTVAHIAVAEDTVHIHEDGTVAGVAPCLVAGGVSPERIVCVWARVPPLTERAQGG